jgi:hypothetical protein
MDQTRNERQTTTTSRVMKNAEVGDEHHIKEYFQ